jgi:transcriptional regulator with XRE-family HTH domain
LTTTIDNPAAEHLGDRLARLRRSRGLSQKELAARLGLKVSHLSKVEVGSIRPRADFVPRLSEVFGVSVDYLITGRSFDQRDIRLWERMEALETLPEPQRNHLIEFLDGLISAHEAMRKL